VPITVKELKLETSYMYRHSFIQRRKKRMKRVNN
jgi:hypothetical protein